MTRFALAFGLLISFVTVSAAQDFGNVKSGMLLGIYTAPSQGGMLVTDLIPGYSAEGRLEPGDILLRVAVSENEVYRLRSRFELEHAKMAIGPDREAALEIWRPSQGLMYAWVEFTPIYGPAAAAVSAAPGTNTAKFKLESEKGGARALFRKQPGNQGGQQRADNRQQPSQPRQPNQTHHDASRFFK